MVMKTCPNCGEINPTPHRLVRLLNALVGSRCRMDHPRMDSDKQNHEAIQMVLAAFDRGTEKELRAVIQNHLAKEGSPYEG